MRTANQDAGFLRIVTFTVKETEVMDLGVKVPYLTYRQIAEELTRRHPQKPVTESAVKQRFSRARIRYFGCRSLCKLWEKYKKERRRARKGKV